MFPSEEEKPRAVKKRMPLGKKILIIYGGVLALCLVIIGGMLVLNGLLGSSVQVPETIKQKVKSAVYLPGKLPGSYELVEDSFTYVEEDSVLIYQASNEIGSKLIFSEQQKPQDLDFERFHKGQLESPKTLGGTPYPSVWGKALDGRLTLSILADDTWIMMVTSDNLQGEDMLLIAKGLQKR